MSEVQVKYKKIAIFHTNMWLYLDNDIIHTHTVLQNTKEVMLFLYNFSLLYLNYSAVQGYSTLSEILIQKQVVIGHLSCKDIQK